MISTGMTPFSVFKNAVPGTFYRFLTVLAFNKYFGIVRVEC